jgi:hypothetical protein
MTQPMGGAEGLVDWARLTARNLLGDQEERLAHVEAVVRRAEVVGHEQIQAIRSHFAWILAVAIRD